MSYYEFPCGCRFPIIKESSDPDVMPILDFNADDISFHCPATWSMLGEGKTRGCFQLESQLGRQWTKKLKPEHIEHLGALGALLRPGCLKAVNEQGVSMTQLYCRRKNKEEFDEGYHPAIDFILGKTYGVMTYQEQAMAIATAVAGFSLVDADSLRKAIGKKLAEEMAKVKVMFIEGAKTAGILTIEQAAEVFEWIEKSQRYSFNKSHAISYGITGYQTAFIKAHFPLAFFTAWLAFAKEKMDPHQEVYDLVNDAKLFDIEVMPPDIRSLQNDFHTDGKIIRFGLTNIKGVGKAQVEKLRAAVDKAKAIIKKPVDQWTWYEFLVHCSGSISSNIMASLIKVGALRWMKLSRNEMLSQYENWNQLSPKEQEWIQIRNGMEPPVKPEKPPKEPSDKKPRGKRTKKSLAEIKQERVDGPDAVETIMDVVEPHTEEHSVNEEPPDLDVLNDAADDIQERMKRLEIDSGKLDRYRELELEIWALDGDEPPMEMQLEFTKLEDELYGII